MIFGFSRLPQPQRPTKYQLQISNSKVSNDEDGDLGFIFKKAAPLINVSAN